LPIADCQLLISLQDPTNIWFVFVEIASSTSVAIGNQQWLTALQKLAAERGESGQESLAKNRESSDG
jgi:hypothetical protein